jgi:hypothetical protein
MMLPSLSQIGQFGFWFPVMEADTQKVELRLSRLSGGTLVNPYAVTQAFSVLTVGREHRLEASACPPRHQACVMLRHLCTPGCPCDNSPTV